MRIVFKILHILKKSEVEGLVTVGIIEENNEIKNTLSKLYNNYNFIADTFSTTCDIIINNNTSSSKEVNCSLCLFNSDEKAELNIKKETIIISYGLNPLSTVTASSISDSGEELQFQFCLQRTITSLSGKKIEPQEFPVRLKRKGLKIHSALAIVTFALLFNY